MAGWDEDGPRLAANLVKAQQAAARDALARRKLTLTDICSWHRTIMRGLFVEDAARLGVAAVDLLGEFRGPPKLENIEVAIGLHQGVPSAQVAATCARWIATLQALLSELDARWPRERLDDLDEDGVRAVAETAAWAHSEWVRIHPFANGNGRIARLLGNAILVRYGLPPVFRLRPRPEGAYALAAMQSMYGDHQPMADYVIAQLQQFP